MADYAVRLTGKDDLSKTIANVKNELNAVGKAASNADKIDAKFNKIVQSSAPLKRQLRDLQSLMAKMNFDGLANSEQYTKIAQEAGRIKDAIADASTATQKFASDTMKLDAAIQAVQGIAAASSIATGAMALFGEKNKDVEKAILKVQAALSILNGVQAIANTLNKDSAFMQRLKQIRMAASTKTTIADTVATTANSTATVANTTATVANTAATKAWNTAKAISKALFGDFTGLLILGVGALATYATVTSNSTEELDEQTKAMEDAKNKVRDFNKSLKEIENGTIQNIASKFVTLQAEWKSLKTTADKTEWIKKNSNAFSELGISINSINDAENLMIRNSDAIIKAIQLRARAAVLQKKIEKSLEDGIKNDDGTYKIGFAVSQQQAQELASIQQELNGLFGKTT